MALKPACFFTEFPYGEGCAKAVIGVLDIPQPLKPGVPAKIIAHVAIIVSMNVIKRDNYVKRAGLEIGSGTNL